MLHRAYAPLATRGMRFYASHQPPEKTLERLERGESCLILSGLRPVATVTLYKPDPLSDCDYYRKPKVYAFGQFAVDPAWQGRGLGRQLLDWTESRARELGAQELALDTSEGAHELIALYHSRGFRLVSRTRWASVNYDSVVMAKALR